MRRVKSIVMMTLAVCLLLSMHVFATRETLSLPKNQVWVSCGTVRSGNYSYVSARCYAVYPIDGGSDTFTRIQVQVTNSAGTVISLSSAYTLYETASSSSQLSLKEGYLATKSIQVRFRGNSSAPAYADVYYYGN